MKNEIVVTGTSQNIGRGCIRVYLIIVTVTIFSNNVPYSTTNTTTELSSSPSDPILVILYTLGSWSGFDTENV